MAMTNPHHKTNAVNVPDGAYRAMLTNVIAFTNAYGERLGFEFTLQDYVVDGKKVMYSTNPVLTAKGKLAGVLEGMLGRELTQAEISKGYDVALLIGSECNVLVLSSKRKNGATYSNVERIFQEAA